ncbi:MAG: VirB4 family type IV secretion/conjugal transfer ATPase [Rickettsiales bacterium]|nr:VirB4 family type IV secretion/conjugal transfer ATPase [Rickettsiales bacterium]
MFQLFRPQDKNRQYERAEKSFSQMIPYKYHYDDNTILTKDNQFISVIKLDGFSFQTADDDDVDNKKNLRNNLFKSLTADGLSICVHTIRKRHSAFPAGEFDNIFTKMLNDQWKQKHGPARSFINEYYVSVIKQGPKKTASMLNGIMSKFIKSSNNYEKKMKEAYADLEETRDRICTALSSYHSRLLGKRKNKNGTFSEICEFLSFIANIGFTQPMMFPSGDISKYINTQRLYFSNKTIEVLGANHHKFAGMVSLKEYRPATFAGILDGFLNLPFEFVLTQTFQFTDRSKAVSSMQLQQRRMMQAEDVAISQTMEINEALDSAMSGIFGFGLHHLSIMCIADDVKAVDDACSQAMVTFSNVGLSAVRESLNMEPAFWAQFPANTSYIVRKSTINTLNLAGFVSFHNYPSGKITGNHWGDAVTVIDTTSGTPYFFNFHARDVGHTMIIGPTGGGKTMLLNFLTAQAQKFKPRLFFFDKDRGAEIFIRAINGSYTNINPGLCCNFNPLFLDDTPENRNFLIEWLTVLVSTHGEIVGADETAKLASAVDGIYRLPKKDRLLRNLAPFLGLEIGNSLSVRLKMWHSDGSKAGIFDNDHDMLDFSTNKTFAFDMAEIMKDPIALAPVMLYIFHKINQSLDGTPTMVVMDEAWALIGNKIFAPKIKDWLKVMRKLNAFCVFATQSVEDAAKSEISDTLVQQTATQIFLANLKATNAYREVFMLSKRELALVKTTDPSSRFFLLKQDQDGVVARINMMGMNDMINTLSGRTDLCIMVDQIRKEYGDDSSKWLPIYFDKLHNM